MVTCKFKGQYFHDYEKKHVVYNCPEHDPIYILESGFCIFHDKQFLKSKKNRQKIQKEFQKKIDEHISKSDNNPFFCIGYRLHDIRIQDKEFRNPVYFDEVNISGGLTVSSKFLNHVSFSGGRFSGLGDIDFHGSQFSGDGVVDFRRARFLGESVSFSRVQFLGKGKVTFSGAHFSGGGDVFFSDTRFSGGGNVYFINSQFSGGGNVYFNNVQFSGQGDVDFSKARFSGGGDVSFLDAQFSAKGSVIFRKTRFSGEGNFIFDRAYFSGHGDVSFSDAQFSVGSLSFDGARFSNEGDIYFNNIQFSAAKNVSFAGTQFTGKGFVSFCNSDFLGPGEINFYRAKFGGITSFDTEFKTKVFFRSVYFMLPNEVRFETEDLSKVSFLGTDITRIMFHENARFGTLESKSEEFTILDERRFIESIENVTGRKSSLEVRQPDTGKTSLGNVLASYRNLRENYEYRLLYDEAGLFFIREMEMKRKYREKLSIGEKRYIPKENDWFRRNFSLTGLYYHLSRYGESISRPIILGGIIVGLSTLFWLIQNNPTGEPSISYSAKTLADNFINFTQFSNSTHTLKAFERSLADFLPLLSMPNDTKVGMIDFIVKIVGGGLTFVLLGLALRRKFERKYTR